MSEGQSYVSTLTNIVCEMKSMQRYSVLPALLKVGYDMGALSLSRTDWQEKSAPRHSRAIRARNNGVMNDKDMSHCQEQQGLDDVNHEICRAQNKINWERVDE